MFDATFTSPKIAEMSHGNPASIGPLFPPWPTLRNGDCENWVCGSLLYTLLLVPLLLLLLIGQEHRFPFLWQEFFNVQNESNYRPENGMLIFQSILCTSVAKKRLKDKIGKFMFLLGGRGLSADSKRPFFVAREEEGGGGRRRGGREGDKR